MKINNNIIKYVITPLIAAVLFLLIFRIEFRFYSFWRFIGVFVTGYASMAVAILFSEVIRLLFGDDDEKP